LFSYVVRGLATGYATTVWFLLDASICRHDSMKHRYYSALRIGTFVYRVSDRGLGTLCFGPWPQCAGGPPVCNSRRRWVAALMLSWVTVSPHSQQLATLLPCSRQRDRQSYAIMCTDCVANY
jgi:hypothetical protein